MKKLSFLTMVVGLMLAFGGSMSAQRGVVKSITNDANAMKPAVGDNISLIVATAAENMPELGLQKGTQYCVLSIRQGRDLASIFSNKGCSDLSFTKFQHKITKVNPNGAEIKENDKAVFYPSSRTIEFYRGANKVLSMVFEQ